MKTLETWTLWVHVAAGVLAVVAGIGALVTAKGRRRHRQVGKIFVVSMGVVVATVFLLLAVEPTSFRIFLALVAVFSGYFAFSGYRVLSRKRPADDAAPVDWLAAVSVVVACLGLGGWGVAQLAGGTSFGTVLVAFGAIGLVVGGGDLRQFRATDRGEEWLTAHLSRMLAAFVAAVSAVSAVNLTGTLGFVAWLWPTAVGTPLIIYWARKYDDR
ncbi:hypothetical protein [Halorussus litoreus]|uniref:hypothetical protein n=1 Tax=Halorussus litoreus TaxID=1710536 RepID=UPI000E2531EE|nr:hypothetical protein [Halorussus litoreus]